MGLTTVQRYCAACDLVFVVLRFSSLYVFVCVSLGRFIPVLLVLVVLDLVPSVPSQEIG